jgi:hypothetical protein
MSQPISAFFVALFQVVQLSTTDEPYRLPGPRSGN